MQITNEVLASKLDALRDLTEEKFRVNEKEHANVIAQQKVTNGRINRLEDWKARAIGVFFVVNAIFLPALFLILSRIL